MFDKKRFYRADLLEKFMRSCEQSLFSTIVEVKYPAILRRKVYNIADIWSQHYKEIDNKNRILFDKISKKAGVYAIHLKSRGNPKWGITYIGQTQEKSSKSRIRNHLVKKHKNTGAKLSKVQSAVNKQQRIGFSFVCIEPASMRHYVEEELCGKHKEKLLWNIHNRIKNT